MIGVNSSYFYQGTCRKLQMYKEQSISDVEPISEGDIIAVKVKRNFFEFWSN